MHALLHFDPSSRSGPLIAALSSVRTIASIVCRARMLPRARAVPTPPVVRPVSPPRPMLVSIIRILATSARPSSVPHPARTCVTVTVHVPVHVCIAVARRVFHRHVHRGPIASRVLRCIAPGRGGVRRDGDGVEVPRSDRRAPVAGPPRMRRLPLDLAHAGHAEPVARRAHAVRRRRRGEAAKCKVRSAKCEVRSANEGQPVSQR